MKSILKIDDSYCVPTVENVTETLILFSKYPYCSVACVEHDWSGDSAAALKFNVKKEKFKLSAEIITKESIMNDKRKRKSVPSWTSDFFLYLSGFLVVLGIILAIAEVPVRITTDPYAADQTELMHAYLPFSVGLWILGFIFFGCSLFLWSRKPLDATQQQQH